jgi:hypothetical protein
MANPDFVRRLLETRIAAEDELYWIIGIRQNAIQYTLADWCDSLTIRRTHLAT